MAQEYNYKLEYSVGRAVCSNKSFNNIINVMNIVIFLKRKLLKRIYSESKF